MISVLRDNTKEKFYTKCKHCGSEFEYEYDDVHFKEVAISYNPDSSILCPVCKSVTQAELTTKKDYKESLYSLRFTDIGSSTALLNSCTFNGDNQN